MDISLRLNRGYTRLESFFDTSLLSGVCVKGPFFWESFRGCTRITSSAVVVTRHRTKCDETLDTGHEIFSRIFPLVGIFLNTDKNGNTYYSQC